MGWISQARRRSQKITEIQEKERTCRNGSDARERILIGREIEEGREWPMEETGNVH
jgi:hypothetical protein